MTSIDRGSSTRASAVLSLSKRLLPLEPCAELSLAIARDTRHITKLGTEIARVGRAVLMAIENIEEFSADAALEAAIRAEREMLDCGEIFVVAGPSPPFAVIGELISERTIDWVGPAQSHSELRISYFVMAVAFAPFAEEYLFRGLLFRALYREWKGKWHGWLAILGSATFFASYHPVLSWPPVFLLGAVNAYLFKKTGKLAPCVLLHMIYNAVVLS